MKRSEMPRRKSPMKRGKALARGQVKQTLDNGKRSAPWHRARQWCFDRAKGRCEAQVSPDCTGHAEHAHHRLLRSQGGPDDESNLLAVCHRCHGWIHDHPAESYERGFMLHRAPSEGG